MEKKGIERRACIRFEIPGATVNYKVFRFSPKLKRTYDEEFCPILDISRGGLRFLCQNKLDINAKIKMKVSVPGERIPLEILGKVRWSAANPGKSYKYQTGVQFNPYGEKKKQNYPGSLVKIIALEQKFAQEEDSEDSRRGGDFEVDG
ncbi:MAG: PilZ domain-containing protein [Candidatus Aminicenantes bacterium]|nr:PilZ domain-containing protein [Candidatus Aminicenantes bacterium]HHF52406.1 PilZ domain-containing protein [Candidatus Aminicenantes bacterium]